MAMLVPVGPYRKAGQPIALSEFGRVFQSEGLRQAAFLYFRHMWELYTFWSFLPIMLSEYFDAHVIVDVSVSFWSFLIIGLGGLACVMAGLLAQVKGAKFVATAALRFWWAVGL